MSVPPVSHRTRPRFFTTSGTLKLFPFAFCLFLGFWTVGFFGATAFSAGSDDNTNPLVVLNIPKDIAADSSPDARRIASEELVKASNGLPQSEYHIGIFFLVGYGIEKDLSQALWWLEKAADNGHVPSQLALGALHGGAEGVTPDYPEALKWFTVADEKGDPTAELALGVKKYLDETLNDPYSVKFVRWSKVYTNGTEYRV